MPFIEEWTQECDIEALKQGWGLFCCDDGIMRIKRVDDPVDTAINYCVIEEEYFRTLFDTNPGISNIDMIKRLGLTFLHSDIGARRKVLRRANKRDAVCILARQFHNISIDVIPSYSDEYFNKLVGNDTDR